MIKRVIEQIFQAHAADSLRKTLEEVERAASGRLHNESLADYVTRLASFKYDAEQRMAALADDRALMDEWHSVSLENGREPDELMGDYMVRIWNAMNVAQRFSEDQKEKLEKAQKEWQERDAAQSKSFNRRLDELAEEAIKQKFRADDIQRELAKAVSMANERAQEISKLRGTHADDIARIDKLSAQLAEIEAEATECGRDEGETVPKFMSRLVIDLGDERASSMAMAKALAESKEDVACERDRGNRINAEYEADMKKIMTTANALGRAAYEAPDAFMKRQESAITGLKSDVIRFYGLADTLGRTSSESIPDFMKRQAEEIAGLRKRIDRVIADRTPSEALKYQYDLADKLGRSTNERLTDFMTRQNAALDSQTTRINEVIAQRDLERQELQDKAQQLLKVQGWHEENLQKIKSLEGDCARLQSSITEACEIAKANGRTEAESLGWFMDRICAASKRKDQTVARLQKVLTKIHDAAKSGGLKQGEKIGAFIERLNEELYKVRCDADSESMKMGNANRRLQHAYDEADEERKVSKRFHALAVEERNNAQEEVRKLSADLANETRRLRAHEDDHAQIYALSAAAVMQGSESVGQCLERKLAELSTVTADRDRIRAELAAILAEANKSGRCNGDPVQLIKQGQADLDALRSMEHEYADQDTYIDKLETQIKDARADIIVTTAQRDSAERRVQELSGTTGLSGEINRLFALVAELQVALDDAKSQYGGIMAQLGNETPLQLIERMKCLVKDRNRDLEEVDRLRKSLRLEIQDHADARRQLADASKTAFKNGLGNGEVVTDFIERKATELAGALQFGSRMQDMANERGDKLRAALATVESQSIAIAEAHRVTEQYTAAVEALAKLKEWASTVRHKVMVKVVHDKAMAEYDNIMKELDGKAGTDGR